MNKVMLIDDEESLQSVLRMFFEKNGFEFCAASNAEEGLAMLEAERPDILLLDVMLPGTNGFDLCRDIRARGRRIPIVFLTAKSDIVDKSIGFTAGGDDYVSKPFDSAELLLRVNAHIRRHKEALGTSRRSNQGGVARAGNLEIYFGEYRVVRSGDPVPLTSKEFELLALLAANPGKVYSREEIVEGIWGERDTTEASNVTVLVRRIREKIEANASKPELLQTVWRVGYKFTEHTEFGQ